MPDDQLTIRPCTQGDMDRFVAEGVPGERMFYRRRRFEMQEQGKATYLLAFRGDDDLAGWVTVLMQSRYPEVVDLLGEFPELNALEATPTGVGTGSALMEHAEAMMRLQGFTAMGIAVQPENVGARRLYERSGYNPAGVGTVLDVWDEVNADGEPVIEHREICDYLLKRL